MNDLVIIKNDVPVVSTFDLFSKMGYKEHRKLKEVISAHKEAFEDLGKLPLEREKPTKKEGGRPSESYLLNEDQFILLVLLAAMFYHREPTGLMLRFYQLVYLTMALVLGVDVIYFWQTSMHVQAVFFRNLNIYAAEGVLSSFSAEQGEALLAAVVVIFLLFQHILLL